MPNKLKFLAIKDRPNLIQAIHNMGWLLFDKVFRLGLSFVVTLWLARYLEPELFGIYNYAIALVAMLSVVASLGLNTLVVQRLVQFPDQELRILGSAFVIQLAGGLSAFLLGLACAWFLSAGDQQIILAVVVLSSSNLFRFSDGVRSYFEAKVRSKHLVIVENLVFLVILIFRVAMILNGASLIWFVCLLVAEAAFTAIAFLILLRGRVEFSELQIRFVEVKELFLAAWPLALSSLAIMLYMRVDQVMLGVLLSQDAVGVYSAAVRISELWYFLPTVIVASVFPRIIQSMANNAQSNGLIASLLSALSLLAYSVAALVSVFSQEIIHLLYGSSYSVASQVLQVHVWSAVFVFAGIVGSRWLVAQGLQRFLFYSTALGALFNVVLNLYFIPRYGPTGAAWATLIAQMVSAFLLNACHPIARGLFKMQCSGFVLTGLSRLLQRTV